MKVLISSPFIFLLSIALSILISCEGNPNPAEGTKVTSTSPEFKELAQKINPNLDCQRIDCCFMDGIETSCAFVNACLEAGFCELVATN